MNSQLSESQSPMAGSETCNKSFCSNYLLVVPEEARLTDLVRFLFSRHVDRRRFIDTPKGTEIPFVHRLIISASVLMQIFLKLIAKPLAWLGYVIEKCLNLLSANGGFFGLIFNILLGRAISIPDTESSNYRSLIGLLDNWKTLDENIPFGDSRYNSALAIMAAKVCYENSAYIESIVSNYWKMDFLGFYNFWNDYEEKATTQAFLFRQNQNQNTDNELICVAFRGTSFFDADDWITDVDISWYELGRMGRVHAGFMKALGLQKSEGWPKNINKSDDEPAFAYYTIREMLRQLLEKNPKAKFIVTGHSLGAALAVLFPAILVYHEETSLLERLEGVYTYGQPRVGDEQFAEFMKASVVMGTIPKYFRIVYCNDLVPRIPWHNASSNFKHFGTCIYFNSLYRGKIVAEVPNKNYFSIFKFIPKKLNGLWELLRGFVIGFVLGPEYRELKLLRAHRVLGILLLVGITAHCPPDYVNSTRLASPDLYAAFQGLTNKETMNKWFTRIDPDANNSPANESTSG